MAANPTWIPWGWGNIGALVLGLSIAATGLSAPSHGRADQHSWLGISMTAGPQGKGVLVVEVVDDSPADEAKFRVNDLIFRIDQESINSTDDLIRVIQRHDPGETVRVAVRRDGKELTLPVTLGERPEHVFQFRVPALEFFGWRAQGRLGVGTQGLTEQLAEYFKVPGGKGVLVVEVMEGSPAGKAGAKAGDVILEVNKEGVASARDIQQALSRTEPCEEIPLVVLRKEERTTLPVTLAWSSWRSRVRLGIQTQELSDQLAEHFRVPEGKGVLIAEVLEDSPARKAGLKAGDVVVEVDGERIGSTEEIHEVLDRRAPCDQVPVVVLRDGQRRSFAVTLIGAPGEASFSFSPLGQLPPQVPQGFPGVEPWFREQELKEKIQEALEAARPELEKTMEELRQEIERLKEELKRLKREGA